MKILVSTDDFDAGKEIALLKDNQPQVGAVVSFVGTVRDVHAGVRVTEMMLEHYPEMTTAVLKEIVQEALSRWEIIDATVIHRVGRLLPTDQIVFVGVTSMHRQAAFLACEYIMDALKTRAPLWKKENTALGEHWIEAKSSDEAQAKQWQE